MRLLLLAPHQDDEILSAGGIIQQCTENQTDVSILFATNGDRFGADIARQRYEESCNALAELGISANHIFYMGYGDTGMSPEHSFLFRLQTAPANTILSSYVSKETYHPAGEKTIRALRTGANGPMTKADFLSDLAWYIQAICPDFILCPSIWDAHGDHAALAMLLHEILPTSMAGASYLIHGGNDMSWPQRGTDFYQKPLCLPSELWHHRIVIKLSDKQQSKKRHSIECFFSQMVNDTSGFLISFAKHEEFFFHGMFLSNREDKLPMEIRRFLEIHLFVQIIG